MSSDDTPEEQTDLQREAGPPEEVSAPETRAEKRFRRRVGISLAALAMLGAWIAVLATNAGTNESAAARDATRLSAEAQAADVLSQGFNDGLDQVEAELDLLPTRGAFQAAEALAESFGATLDPALAQERLDTARTSLGSALDAEGSNQGEFDVEARRLALEQEVVVQQRVEWNAFASQYETVLTVLAIAIFLVGFALVLGRKLRPPVAIPGLILAIVCAGWAVQIYTKPKTEVSETAVTKTAEGDHALATGQFSEASDDFTVALDATPDYFEALSGRSLAVMLEANPDLVNTTAFTDTSTEVTDAAAADTDAALESGGETDSAALAVASIVALAQNDWGLAADRLEQGIELNELAAELYLWRSAVAVAQGDEEAAQSWLSDAVDRFGDTDDQRSREFAAQYLSLLSFVADREPERAEMAQDFTLAGVASIAEAAAGRPLLTGAAPDAAFTAVTVTYDDASTFLKLGFTGVAEDTIISIVVHELPSVDASWVQPPELFYTGGPGQGQGDGVTIGTERNCVALEYRFDLYVEGELRDSVTAAGADATC